MNHANTSFSTEIFDGAIISVVQCLEPLQWLMSTSNRTIIAVQSLQATISFVQLQEVEQQRRKFSFSSGDTANRPRTHQDLLVQ
jgi:hypothetical protein